MLALLLVLALGPAIYLALKLLVARAGPQPAPVPVPIAGGAPVLECRDIYVQFGGLQALGGVDLDVYEGEIVGLIGPNGAGKTTLMECISGFQRSRAGSVRYRGEDLLAHARRARGPGSASAARSRTCGSSRT